MLSNKTIDIIRVCMKTTLTITRGDTEGSEKARNDIKNALNEFDEYITEIEAGQEEVEDNLL